jgi:hypothetical protein
MKLKHANYFIILSSSLSATVDFFSSLNNKIYFNIARGSFFKC